MTINAQVEGEHGSIVTMYYAFSKGASMGMAPGGKPRSSEGTYQAWMSKELPYALSPDLIQVLNDSVLSNGDKINGAKTPKGTLPWVNTWVNQTLEIGKYIGQNVNVSDKDNSSGDNKWLYGMFGKNPRKDDTTIPGIPNQLVSTALQCVWDVYSDLDDEALKKAFGKPAKKDSWNPADTFMISKDKEGEIHHWCEGLKSEFISGGVPFSKFVITVNAKLSDWVTSGHLVPISLKAMTPTVSMKYKENNVEPFGSSGKIDVVEGEFTSSPYSYFEIENRSGKLDFKGNSFVFKAKITAGIFKEGFEYDDSQQYYKIEQRMQGTSTKGEVKDIRVNTSGGFRDANAQTGIVPAQKFKSLVTSYAGQGVSTFDKFIPKIGTKLSEYEISYWAKTYNRVKASFRKVGTGIDLGDTTIFGQKYTAYWYFRRAAEFDALDGQAFTSKVLELGGPKKIAKDKFSAKLRNKLCNLRFMQAVINARKKHELCMLLTSVYYGAAKMKMTKDDLQGPFIKVA